MLRWHYTTALHWQQIDAAGAIRPSAPFALPKERPAVWLSSHPLWEPTAGKTLRSASGEEIELTTMQALHCHLGLVRIGVAPSLRQKHWREFMRRTPRHLVLGMERIGRERSADPARWYACLTAIERADWCAVEHWDGTNWVAGPPAIGPAGGTLQTPLPNEVTGTVTST